tara:strand:+ start:261 stop:911 length:651 start_codon:yes stop_codon:yes gene_type:complete
MKFANRTVSTYEKQQEQTDAPQTKQWFNPNEIETNHEVEFVFMEEDPLEFWEVWGEPVDPSDKSKPFRFPMGDDDGPTNKDIAAELGKDYMQQKSKYANKKQGVKVGDPRPAVHCMAWPVWNCEDKCFQVLKVSQPSLQNQIIKTSMLKKYRNKMEQYNHTIHKGIVSDIVTYTYNALERDDDFPEEEVAGLWENQECVMTLLLDNGEPLNPGGNS